MAKPISNPKVGAYIAKSVSFAQPVLTHLRKQIHKACPKIVEEMKWSRLFFLHGGTILCNVSGFKEQCSLGFWGAEIGKVLRGDGVLQEGGMGSLGRITSLKDLPADRELLRYLKQSAAFIDNGQGETLMAISRRVLKAPKAAVEIPSEFMAALKKNKAASRVFKAFSASCQRKYMDWIADAKRLETRNRRTAQAVEWIAEGKQCDWKYQDC